jgi:carotenoid cleavage dioxygenase-like enzyme
VILNIKYQWNAFVFYVSLLQNNFYVIDKWTGQVIPIKYKSKKAFFLFHHINTYEEAGQVCVDVQHMKLLFHCGLCSALHLVSCSSGCSISE